MLAFELYRKNRESTVNNPNKESLFKKIFYYNGVATLDIKTCEEYGSRVLDSSRAVQECLQMPLNTIEIDELNLPDYATSNVQSPPYIRLYGKIHGGKMEIKIQGKKDKDDTLSGSRTYILDLVTKKTTSLSEGKTIVRVDQKKYTIDGKPLFEKYVESTLIDGNSILNGKACDVVVSALFEAAKSLDPVKANIPFLVYVLPFDGKIGYVGDEPVKGGPKFIDSFGNKTTHYSNSTTQNTKFLTYDDPIYTPNCKGRSGFYRNIGIGAESLAKVYVDKRYATAISGMTWIFVDLNEDVEPANDIGRHGLLAWLKANYDKMKIITQGNVGADSMMKVMCIKQAKSQQEVLVDENLTMKRLGDMFDGLPDIPTLCLEVLIDTSGSGPVWDTYMDVARRFLSGKRVSRKHLLMFFVRYLAKKGLRWRSDRRSAPEVQKFFARSRFCLLALNKGGRKSDHMEVGEHYAESVGRLAKIYVEFKKVIGDGSNSLSDILSYSKYDRDKLRFVVARVGRGIQLTNASDTAKSRLESEMAQLDMRSEIEDAYSHKDYSYFFYRGYYWNGGDNK